MDPERLRQVEQLYHAALERAAGERDAFLDDACQRDSALRREVATLLAADEHAGRFLAAPAVELAARAIAADEETEAGDVLTHTRGAPDDVTGLAISHYQILDVLGQGGMGVVYRAVDTRLNRTVALKRLHPAMMANADRTKRFVQEARAASALNHPHIVTVYDLDSDAGVDFIAMEYVEGNTLHSLLAGGGGLRVRDALKYGVQIADALAAAHDAGIVHRDLKPGNVMINARGDAKVLDFGLAKLTERPRNTSATAQTAQADEALRTVEGMILGTVAFMSPEQAEGRDIDARSDIFAFGALLYEMITGHRAFQGNSSAATLAAVLREEPRPASQMVPGIPAELDHIIIRCLRKEPERRFQHLADVKARLEALRDETTAAKTTFEDRATERVDRASLVVRLAGSLLIVTAVAASAWWLTRGSRSDADTATTSKVAAAPIGPRLSSGGPASSNAEANRLFENAMQSKVINDLPRTRRMLERALELDPNFAEARAWHAFTDWLMLDQGYSSDSTVLYKAEDEMRRAASEDPTLARAHVGLAAIYLMQGRKELIPAEANEALKSNPGDEDVSNILMQYHQYSGDYASAQRVGQQVLDRLPLFFPNRMILGELLRQQGDLAGAIREQQKILEQDPQSIYALTYLAHAHMDLGDLASARETLNRIRADDQRSYRVRRTRALLLALEGRRADALQEMDADVLAWLALVAWETAEAAEFFAVLQDTPKALDWLDRAVRNGDERSEWFRRDPLLASIRDHPRFRQILESITYRRQQRTTR